LILFSKPNKGSTKREFEKVPKLKLILNLVRFSKKEPSKSSKTPAKRT
jgi:hypothetical protein